ncbi:MULTISPECIES: acylphosphatase [Aerococcus]|uniref:acylphosphatase n=1 Tax=Aerococcus sanguinicola TaxID=119206 RepID=A0A5N1GKF9_9LACT|nr:MULTISPECIES: acylphosphatase [Aerococcus]KAA9300894.1 acylphosphatase [Aerococcus sanguinicola]MDK6369127.1 acylphosphatase [Aerococcus sp. UMB9870]MDK6679814.1 acylphosphatase [Aerococcus sp. UMB8608]MDK6686620.1 acylphosphatase [Aerococcus sp. UMB8623]MDK6939736.1 acylphosphatase [Aerococcus sp. UMB8487]
MLTSKLRISGRVQGVGFRFHCSQLARQWDLGGSVKNEADGSVSLVLQADAQTREDFLQALEEANPYARIDQVDLIAEEDLDFKDSFETLY